MLEHFVFVHYLKSHVKDYFNLYKLKLFSLMSSILQNLVIFRVKFFYVHCGYDIYTVDEIDKEINHKGKSNTVLLIHYYSIVKNSFEYL